MTKEEAIARAISSEELRLSGHRLDYSYGTQTPIHIPEHTKYTVVDPVRLANFLAKFVKASPEEILEAM